MLSFAIKFLQFTFVKRFPSRHYYPFAAVARYSRSKTSFEPKDVTGVQGLRKSNDRLIVDFQPIFFRSIHLRLRHGEIDSFRVLHGAALQPKTSRGQRKHAKCIKSRQNADFCHARRCRRK
uniref:Uncharacterized protein RTR2 n=1 Tax=Avian adenovirus 8 (strain ATCC A-2A) TaxID=66295 RepID=Q9YYQ5_ADEG8|nr:unknown [Fowl aviadenovirus 8]